MYPTSNVSQSSYQYDAPINAPVQNQAPNKDCQQRPQWSTETLPTNWRFSIGSEARKAKKTSSLLAAIEKWNQPESDSEEEEEEESIEDFLQAVHKSLLAKTSTQNVPMLQQGSTKFSRSLIKQKVCPRVPGISPAFSQDHSEQIGEEKRRTDLAAKPMSFKIALERLKALQLEESTILAKPPSTVFIYDIEDITQLSFDIIAEVGRLFPDLKNVSKAIENALQFVERQFFDVSTDENINGVMNIRDELFNGKISEYLEFKHKCETRGPNIIYEFIKAQRIINPKFDLYRAAEKFQKLFDQPWQSAKKCLQAISDKSLNNTYENVILCDVLGYGAAQLLISGLASEVPLENVYSKYEVSEEKVFKRIRRNYGTDCQFVVVTSNANTAAAAEKQNIQVWGVDPA